MPRRSRGFSTKKTSDANTPSPKMTAFGWPDAAAIISLTTLRTASESSARTAATRPRMRSTRSSPAG